MKIVISKEPYKDKDMARAAVSFAERRNYKQLTGNRVKAIKWSEVNIAPRDFYDLVLRGYAWTTGLYKDKLSNEASKNNKGLVRKNKADGTIVWMDPFYNGYINNGFLSEDWWGGSYCMFVDIDDTRSTSIEDYCSKIPQNLLPTFGFYSPSDKPNTRRFKLVWVFNQSINDAELWKAISKYIHNGLNSIEPMKDKCGTTITQISYGNQGGSGVYFGYTYDAWMFDWLKNTIKTDEEIEAENNGKNPDDIQIDQKLIDTLKRNFPVKSLKYINYVNWIWRKEDEVDWIGRFPLAYIGLCKEDYWELQYNFGVKIKDGHERRKKLFMRMCLRRILKPDATPEEILLNAYRDREEIIDNSDGVVNVDNLVRNVKTAFSYTIEELESMFKSTIEYLKKTTRSIVFKYYKGRSYTREEYNIIKGRFTQYLISCTYDPKLSEKDNIDKFNNAMKEWGYKLRIEDREVLYKFRKDNNINKTTERDLFIMKKHNEGLSATQINEELVDNGFKSMSKSQINRLIAKLKKNQTTTEIDEEKEDITQKPIEDDDWAKWLFPVSPK